MPSATAGGSPRRRRFSAPTSPACWCGTVGVAYRGFKKAPHQTCLAHLLRRCKDLQAAHPDSPWAGAVQAVLRDGLALRDRSNAGEISEHGLASARGRLAARLGRLIDTAPPLAAAERFAKHLANEFPAVFLFLCDPSIGRHQLAGRTGHPTRSGHA